MSTGVQLQSTVRKSGDLEIALKNVSIPEPADDEVVIGVEATPINPSDLGLLLAGADVSKASNAQRDGETILTAPITPGIESGRVTPRKRETGPSPRSVAASSSERSSFSSDT